MSGAPDFWARRKAGVQAEREAEITAREAEALRAEHAALEEKTDADILAELELPEPESLKMGDDFTAFMAKAVPDRIRRRALRTLWRSNPVLANVDMLVDYGEDFTDSALVVENLQTAYQVGKGMMKHVEEMARQAEERENPPEIDAPEVEEVQEVVVAEAAVAEPDADLGPVPFEAETFEREQDSDAFVVPTPRRMKFTIKESAA